MQKSQPAPRFTLIELLVVVAIIAILAAFLLPAMAKARARSQEVQCSANQSQSVKALMLYADDMEGHVAPGIPVSHQGNINSGAFRYQTANWDLRTYVGPYVNDFRSWRCAVHENVPIDDPGNTRNQAYGSFSYFPGRRRYPNFGDNNKSMPTRLYAITGDASTFVMLQDRFLRVPDGSWFMTHADGELVRGITDNPSNSGIRTVLPNSGNANMTFYDGHVERRVYQDTVVVGQSTNSATAEYSVLPDW